MIEELPGYKDATGIGYSLSSYSGDFTQATYRRIGIDLTVYNDGTCTISSMIGLFVLSSGKMQFPNKNFKIFEHQMSEILEAVEHGYGDCGL